MNNLLKLLTSSIGLFVATIIPVACSDDSTDSELEKITIPGKVFVYTYENKDPEIHEAGIEILEFKTNDSVYRHSVFCLLAGDYLQMSDGLIKGRYGVVGNTVMLGLNDTIMEAKLYNDNGIWALNWATEGKYLYSTLTVDGNKAKFERIHKHNMLDPVVKPSETSITVEKGDRYLACSNRKSFVMNIDSVSGSHAQHNQVVAFNIANIPGDFRFSEEAGTLYLMKFGTMAYLPVDKETAESNPDDIVAILLCDDKAANYTIASPSEAKMIKGANAVTSFAKLKRPMY